jgi:hypothetical protein
VYFQYVVRRRFRVRREDLMRCYAIAVLLSLLTCSFAFAQGVFQSSGARTQPLVSVRDGDYINCGVRVVSVQDSEGRYPVRAVDYSVGIWLREPEMALIGMAKFVAWRISSETEMRTAGGSQLQVVGGWVRSESGGPLRPHPLAQPTPGDDPQTLLLITEAIDTAEFLQGVLDPARVLVGIRAKDD